MKFYTFVSENNDTNIINMKSSKSKFVYLRLAEKLAESLSLSGNFLTILTHQPTLLKRLVNPNIKNIEIVKIGKEFLSQIPKTTKFYHAHSKLDCFQYFSTLEINEPLFLIDCDVIQIRNFPKWFCNEKLSREFLYLYSITRQLVSAYGKKYIENDLSNIISKPISKWFGGEIIGAYPDSYKKIYLKSMEILPKYISSLNKLNHVGDETITNAVIQKLKLKVIDLGELNIIERKWSARCKHIQLPVMNIKNLSFIHLPSSKIFLLNLPQINFNISRILLICYLYFFDLLNLIKFFFYKIKRYF